MGSISGVKPTAIEMPNKKAFSQSPFVIPLIKKTRGTSQCGAFLDDDRHVALEVDRAGQVAAYVERQLAAAVFADEVYRLLDRARVVGRTVRFHAEERGLILLGRNGAHGRADQQEGECEEFRFDHGLCF